MQTRAANYTSFDAQNILTDTLLLLSILCETVFYSETVAFVGYNAKPV